MLNCGHNRVSPANGMWPLFCNEVGLSYDQEERVRSFQRDVILRHETWLYRHISYGSQHVMKSLHDAILGACEVTKKREKNVMDVLTEEQRLKFLVWKKEKMKRFVKDGSGGGKKDGAVLLEKLTQALEKKLDLDGESSGGGGSSPMETDEKPLTAPTSSAIKPTTKIAALADCPDTNANHHDAANLYILNHKLSQLTKSSLPITTPLSYKLSPLVLKRLSRRPSFESLAAVHEEPPSGNSSGKKGGKKQANGSNNSGSMARVISSGSLKRCSSEMSCDENALTMNAMKKSGSGHSLSSAAVSLGAASPEAAQVASAHVVSSALGSIRSLIPAMIMNPVAVTATRPVMVVNRSAARPRANTIAGSSSLQSDYSNSTIVQGNNTGLYQQNHSQQQQQPQQVSSSIQPIYQPSSSAIPMSNQQQSNVIYSNTTQSYPSQQQQPQQQQQQVAPMQDTNMFSYNNNLNTAIPNTVPSSVVNPTNTMHKTTYVSPEPSYSAPTTTSTNSYSTTTTFHTSNPPQQQSSTLHHGNGFHPGMNTNNNTNTLASVNSVSAPVLSGSSQVPSPLLLSDQNQQQPTGGDTDSNMDMILDDSVLQPYDVGNSFYNVSNQAADDSLFELTEEDWAIGEGAFLD